MIQVVYPKDGHETHEAATFLLGSVVPGTSLRINGQAIDVHARGYFASPISLSPGENRVKLESDSGEQRVLTVLRHPPKAPLSPEALGVDVDTMMPSQFTVQAPGHWLQVACLATPGARLSVTIPGVLDTGIPLKPHPQDRPYVDNRQGIFGELHQDREMIPAEGYYEGSILIPYDAPARENMPLHLEMHHPNGDSLIQEFPGRLSIRKTPQCAVITGTGMATLRTGPSASASRLTPQLPGTWLVLDGQVGPWCRIRLGRDEVAWIAEADIDLQENTPQRQTTWIPRMTVRQVRTRQSAPRRTEVQIPLREKIPLNIRNTTNSLTLSLYGAESHCDVIAYDPKDTLIEGITWHQVGESRVDLHITCPHLAGYNYAWNGDGLILTLKAVPEKASEAVILIDPGHGGEETGTHGPDGLPEKTLNLAVSQILISALKDAGFSHIRPTRTSDATVSLDQRIAQATAIDADLVLSLHHNALPDGRNPLEHRGVSTYYYHAFARPLARKLLAELVRNQPALNYGLFHDSLAMTRIHTATAVLIELGFFTHPDDYARVIDPANQQAAAQTLAHALKGFVENR